MSVRASIPVLPARHVDAAIRREDAPLATTSHPFVLRLLAIPTVWQLIAIYFATRIVTTTIMLVFAANQPETWQTPAQPDYFTFANIWDAVWYRWIGEGGYPRELPVGDHGRVTENAWAFMPVFPAIVRVISLITTLPFPVVAVLVSVAAGLATVFAFHRLLRRFVGERTALFAVLLLCLGPVSPMFQVGYAEALHFWLLCELLILLVDRRWLEMLPIVLLASLTRPTGLAWAFTLLLVILHRYWQARVARLERFEAREQRQAWIAAFFSGFAGLAWLAIAGFVTGRPFGYLETEMAWRNHYTSGAETLPFTAWFWAGDFWFGQPLGTMLVVAVVIGVIAWFSAPFMLRFGIEIRMWGIAYFSYLFAVFYPQSSIFRLCFPLFPALAPVALPQSPVYRVVVSLLAVAAQVAWLTWMWFVIGHDWTPP